jgi:hypothetical protein
MYCLEHSPSLGKYGWLDCCYSHTNVSCFQLQFLVQQRKLLEVRLLIPELARLLRPRVQFRTSHGTKKSLQYESVFFAYLLRHSLFLDWHFQKDRKYKSIRRFMTIGIFNFSKYCPRNFELTFPKLQDLYASVNFSGDATFIVRSEVLTAVNMKVYRVVYFFR